MSERLQDGIIDMEQTPERTGKFICTLESLGLGNPNGIPSIHAHATEAEHNERAASAAEKLVTVTDLRACACIDGRHTICNADGSASEYRLRRVGGSASNYGVALNAEASVVATVPGDASLEQQIDSIDLHVTRLTGFEQSAHKGGCGGANGEVEDNDAINTNANILNAVKALMSLPQVSEYLGAAFDDVLAERVRVAAGKTAKLQRLAGWSGQAYVDKVTASNPMFVEDLQVDEQDEQFHGHREREIVIVIGDETVADDDVFVWNLKASKMIAEALAGERGHEGYVQALIAELAKHLAVASRLASTNMPITILASS